MKKALFIDRDGTLIKEPADEQIDTLAKLEFLPNVIKNLAQIRKVLDFELVIVSNQDGLGTKSFPTEDFELVQDKFLTILANEGIHFDDILIDDSFPQDLSPNRKPRTGMLSKYLSGDYDLASCFVIGDRLTDIELAKNLGAKGIFIGDEAKIAKLADSEFKEFAALTTNNWDDIYAYLLAGERTATVTRTTKETDISIHLDLDGNGITNIETGLSFFDHMLDQIGKHSGINLTIKVKGDLNVDEHHTVEDTALALGEAIYKALGSKRGIERYGFCLPMDDCNATVALDFGGRNWLEWNAEFKREKIGDVPTEMFFHFFKSFTDTAKCNLYVKGEGVNEHHKIEGIYKAFAKAIKMAIKRDVFKFDLPSTKGVL